MVLLLFILQLRVYSRLHKYHVCSWQEFCMDVSLEKGGWHLESSAEDAGPVGRDGNSCSLMADKITPSNNISMQGTG